MDEMNVSAMIELQERLTKKLLSPAVVGEERKQAVNELKVVSDALIAYMSVTIEQDKADVEREKIDADIRKSEIAARSKNLETKRSLKGDVAKATASFGSSLVGGAATLFTVWKIVGAEAKDILVISKALSHIPKFHF